MGVYFNYLEYMHIYNTYIFITKHIQILYIYICNTILHHVGKGNGNPLWYSCLKIPLREEPGRLQSMGSQKLDSATKPPLYHVICHFK